MGYLCPSLHTTVNILMQTSGKRQQKLKWIITYLMELGNWLIYLLEQSALVLDGYFELNAMHESYLIGFKFCP